MADLTTYDPLFLALFANADGTSEIAGNGYGRLGITNDGSVFSVGGGGERTSIVPLKTVQATGTGWGSIRSIGFYDTSTGGSRLAWVAIAPETILAGAGLSFLAGNLGYTAGDPGAITPAAPGTYGEPRFLYLLDNRGIQALARDQSDLFVIENRAIQVVVRPKSFLYELENREIQALAVLARSLFELEAINDGEVFPWLARLVPAEQYPGGQVGLIADGLGGVLEISDDAVLTADSIRSGTSLGAIRDGTSDVWGSNLNTPGAWIRFTFPSARKIAGVALLDQVSNFAIYVFEQNSPWGPPTFRFDSGPDIIGAPTPMRWDATKTINGSARTFYAFDTPRLSTYVEVRADSGGGAAQPCSLVEAWIFEDTAQAAESASAVLNFDLPAEETMGIASWGNRAEGLWPAAFPATEKAVAIVVVPVDATSGLVRVEEAT